MAVIGYLEGSIWNRFSCNIENKSLVRIPFQNRGAHGGYQLWRGVLVFFEEGMNDKWYVNRIRRARRVVDEVLESTGQRTNVRWPSHRQVRIRLRRDRCWVHLVREQSYRGESEG